MCKITVYAVKYYSILLYVLNPFLNYFLFLQKKNLF